MNAAALGQTLDAIATLIESGDFRAAEQRAQAALQWFPQEAETWRLLAIAQLKSGKTDAALKALQRAHALAPQSVEVLCNLAAIEIQGGAVASALQTLERAFALAPDHAGVLANLGRLRHRVGDYAGSAVCFDRRIQLQPNAPEAWLDLANTRVAQFRWDEAEECIKRALGLDTQSPDGWYLAGYLFERSGRLSQAATAYQTALNLRPSAQVAHNLGLVHDQLDNWQDAARLFEQALLIEPTLVDPLGHLTFAKRRLCDWSGLAAISARLVAAVEAGVPGTTPFSFLAENATPQQQLACSRTFARSLIVPVLAREPIAPIAADAPLRVVFVSSGFNQHATGLLIVELIERLRSTPLHTIAFATTAGDGTALRRRLESAFNEFHDVARVAPGEIAARIRAARVEIVIDVDGYCMGSIPQLFALRPAPLQVNFLAYPGTLGAPWYDYLIADEMLIPAAQRAHYDERIAYLPRCYQPSDTTRALPVTAASREQWGLPASGFVFCCFNATWKITPESFALWMRILHALPGSVLWLLDGAPGNGIAGRLRAAAQRAGIDAGRLVISPKAEHAEYLARLRRADLFLDTNPYNAHTTASDAVYAGCPVLTRPGETFASRVAASINRQLGLDELIARDDDEYVRLAIELAQQPDRLRELRERIADPEQRARLFDMHAYAEDFAALLSRMAARHRRGEAPQDLTL
ncbi:MAG: tetratricopeptide repeat protein [Rudaea sp.]